MTETIALRVFWTCMILCALCALTNIWAGPGYIDMRTVPTFFIIGFASFLIWAPIVVYKFFDKLG